MICLTRILQKTKNGSRGDKKFVVVVVVDVVVVCVTTMPFLTRQSQLCDNFIIQDSLRRCLQHLVQNNNDIL